MAFQDQVDAYREFAVSTGGIEFPPKKSVFMRLKRAGESAEHPQYGGIDVVAFADAAIAVYDKYGLDSDIPSDTAQYEEMLVMEEQQKIARGE